MDNPNNPSAFPVPCHQPFGDGELATGGMSLRDWFAGQALVNVPRPRYGQNRDSDLRGIAREAYEIADAMLEEREKEPAPKTREEAMERIKRGRNQ